MSDLHTGEPQCIITGFQCERCDERFMFADGETFRHACFNAGRSGWHMQPPQKSRHFGFQHFHKKQPWKHYCPMHNPRRAVGSPRETNNG